MFPILFATYVAVFVAEIVGDKLLYTTGVLATRYRTPPILLGMAVAFMAKMAVAVLLGKAISTFLPRQQRRGAEALHEQPTRDKRNHGHDRGIRGRRRESEARPGPD